MRSQQKGISLSIYKYAFETFNFIDYYINYYDLQNRLKMTFFCLSTNCFHSGTSPKIYTTYNAILNILSYAQNKMIALIIQNVNLRICLILIRLKKVLVQDETIKIITILIKISNRFH